MRSPLRRRVLIAAVALCLVAATGAAARLVASERPAAAATPAARSDGTIVLALVPAAPDGPTRGALAHHLDRVSDVAPAWGEVRSDGLLDYRLPDARLRELTGRGAGLAPVVHVSTEVGATVLVDAQLRNRVAIRVARAVAALGARAVVLRADAVTLAGRDGLTALTATVARLTGPGVRVVVAVPAATAADPTPQAGYDLRALSRSALVLVEAWQAPLGQTPAPAAPLAWWRDVVRHAVASAPARRLLVAVPTEAVRFQHGTTGTTRQADAYRALPEAARAGEDGAATGDAQDGWATETERSIELKLRVARDAGVAGVAIAPLGGEAPRLWQLPLLDPGTP